MKIPKISDGENITDPSEIFNFNKPHIYLSPDLGLDDREDVFHIRQRTGLMLRGEWLPADQLDAMLDEMAGSY